MGQLSSFPFLVTVLPGDKYMLNIKVLVRSNDLRGLRVELGARRVGCVIRNILCM